MKTWIWLLIFFMPQGLLARSLSFDFSDDSNWESGDLIINVALEAAHPSLRVRNFNGGGSNQDFEVGDGRHGSFDSSTYANFSENGDISGNRIRLSTDDYPILQVTNFVLEEGWILEPIGDNPLIIYSLTDVQVAGDILCSGVDGGDAIGATPGSGGQGRCGGAQGGDGGSAGADGSDGGDADATVTGGQGGNFTGGAAVAGGGAGSWNTSSVPTDGANSNPGGGQAGTQVSNPEFTTLAGGAGGGGGSGTATEAGAGGGGGGGLVIIHAVRDFFAGTAPTSIQGRILVAGGDGGDSNVAGGAGGGGAGGSIQIFSGRGMELYNTDGSGIVRSGFGFGGQNSLVAMAGNGGIGRNWFSNETGKYNLVGTGFYTPAEEAPLVPGVVEFNSVTQTAESVSFDLQSTKVTFNSISVSPTSSDFSVLVAGSDDDFDSDDTGWTTNLSLLEDKRYVKVRISITTTNVNDPDMIDTLTVNYTPNNKEEFDFAAAASCGRFNKPNKPNFWFLVLLMPLVFSLALRKQTV